jgi:hypothetical protein
MWRFYEEMILRALADTPKLVSSNWVAVGVSIVVLVATFTIRVRRQQSYREALEWRGKLSAMRDHWLRDGFISVIVTTIVWLLLFAVSLTRTVYTDHQQISAKTSMLGQERDSARVERDALKAENEELRKHSPRVEKEPADSLRRRTFRLAKEVYDFAEERAAHAPPFAAPNSNDPSPTEETKRAIKISQDYARETETLYKERYRDRLVGIVKEYEAKGVPAYWLANDFQQRPPAIAFFGSGYEGSPMDELYQFKQLAYHVDAHDHLITFY